jgi:hypothetical protein
VNGGGCFASVLLDEELWQSVTAMKGGDAVPWVHGCALDHGHHGDHAAPATHVDGETQHWLRWPDAGPARLEHGEPSPPGRHSKPLGEPPNRRPPRSTPNTGAPAHSLAEASSPSTSSQAEALWAIAAAIERLAEVVAAYMANPPRDNGID